MQKLILLAALAVTAAGCASATAGGPGAPDGAASLVPGSASAFVAARTDAIDTWLPSRPAWTSAVRPALGDELDVAVLGSGRVVGFTQPKDAQKLAALAREHGLSTRKVGAWIAMARSASALDEVGPTALSLAANDRFRAAMERIPGDARVRAYTSGDEAAKLAAAVPGQMETTNAPLGTSFHFGKPCTARPTAATLGCVEFRWGAGSLSEAKGGFKIEGVAKTGALVAPGPPRYVTAPTPPYEPGLVEEIPADVLAFADFPLPSSTFQLMERLPSWLERLFGPSFDLGSQLDAVLHGETAIYVRAALPLPELTLVTQPTDTSAANDALDELIRQAPASSLLGRVTVHRAVIGGQLVLSTSASGIAAFRGGGPKLSGDKAFLEARKLSGMGEQTTGFLYASARKGLPLLKLAGVAIPADLPHLQTLFAFGGQGVNERTFTTFLQVGSS